MYSCGERRKLIEIQNKQKKLQHFTLNENIDTHNLEKNSIGCVLVLFHLFRSYDYARL